LDRRSIAAGVAARVQQALPRGQQGPVSVDLDGAASQHPRELDRSGTAALGDEARDVAIARHLVFPAPPIELEARGEELVVAAQEQRGGIASPAVTIFAKVQTDAMPEQQRLEALGRLPIRHQHLDALTLDL